MVDLNKYKAVIFDWDGTLVDSHGMLLNAHNQVRKEFDEPEWTLEEFLKKPSLSGREFFGMVYPGRAQEADTIFYDFIEKHHLEFLEPMARAEEFITSLDLELGVVSNKRHPTLNLEVDQMQWRDHFVSIVGAGQAERDKPAPDPLLMAMNEIHPKLQGHEILYVGDTETDLKTAKAVGADAVFLQIEGHRPDLLETYQPSYYFNSLEEFADQVMGQVTNGTGKANRRVS